MIWSLVAAPCDPRVLALELEIPKTSENGAAPYHIRPGRFLYDSTAGVRAMLSVDRQCRAEALKWFPDILTINDETGATIRFNKERDMVFLNGSFWTDWMENGRTHVIENFTESIRHLGLGPPLDGFLHFHSHFPDDPHPPIDPIEPIWHVMKFLRPFKNLKLVYYCVDENDYEDYDLRWCASDKINHYEQYIFEGWDTHNIAFCWPNLVHNGHEYVCEEKSYYSRSDRDRHAFKVGMGLVRGEADHYTAPLSVIHERIDPYLSEEDLRRLSNIGFFKMAWFNDWVGFNRYFELEPDSEGSEDDDEAET
ncbi:hypothetical protein F5Y10DRAFT_258613 [Nemania abortiva]|nr:hypothetical protein F5Y10DRAFT_258613 [Nemania abortiva]